MIRLWLDDLRPAPPGWTHALTARDAIAHLESGQVIEASLDHDLGEGDVGSGYEVACAIEAGAFEGRLGRLAWRIHSANPVGRARMTAALEAADRAWDQRETP